MGFSADPAPEVWVPLMPYLPVTGFRQSLAEWRLDSPFDGLGFDSVQQYTLLKERTGVISFKDYWQRPGENNAR